MPLLPKRKAHVPASLPGGVGVDPSSRVWVVRQTSEVFTSYRYALIDLTWVLMIDLAWLGF